MFKLILKLTPLNYELHNIIRWYSLAELYEAWSLLLNASSEFSGTETYEFDLVDITRQALVNQGISSLFKLSLKRGKKYK